MALSLFLRTQASILLHCTRATAFDLMGRGRVGKGVAVVL